MKHRYGQGSGPVCPASWNRLHGHFYKGASFADRIALIKQHIIHLETHLTDDFLLKIYEAHDKITPLGRYL